jgi:hypothetical protein
MLKIDNYYELNALLHALLTLKFEMPVSDSDVREVVSSIYLAAVMNEIYDATIAAAKKSGKESIARALVERRPASTHPREFAKVREHITWSLDYWNRLSHLEKRECIRVIFSPFYVDDDLCDLLISECK